MMVEFVLDVCLVIDLVLVIDLLLCSVWLMNDVCFVWVLLVLCCVGMSEFYDLDEVD